MPRLSPTITRLLRRITPACAVLACLGFAGAQETLERHQAIDIDGIRDTEPTDTLGRAVRALHEADLDAALTHTRAGWNDFTEAQRGRLAQDVVDLAVIRREFALAGYFEQFTGGPEALDASPFKHFARYPAPTLDATRRVRVAYDGFTSPSELQGAGDPINARCIIDTGAQVSAITRSAAAKLGLTVDPLSFMGTVGGAEGASSWGSTSVPLIRLGAARFRNVPCLVIPNEVVTQFGLNPDSAILGLPELARFGTIDFDFKRQQVRMLEATPLYEEEPTRNAAFLGGKLYARVTIDDEPLAGMVDTGTATTVLHDPNRWLDRPQTRWGCDVREWTSPESGETLRLFRCDVPLKLNAASAPGPLVLMPARNDQPFDYDITLGNDRWAEGLLRIDLRSMIVSFE